VFDRALSPTTDFVSKNREKISRALLAVSAAATLLVFVPELLKDTGSWALFLLVFIMFLSPVSSITGSRFLRVLMPFRKEVGILMGVMATVHAVKTFTTGYASPELAMNSAIWISPATLLTPIGWGLAALVFVIALTVTSNRFSMRLLGKNWKLLHRTAYLAFVLTYVHVGYITGEIASAIAVVVAYSALRIAAAKGVKIPAYANS
ncbi:MAG: ferric reductase-like transmembrane domain-containing protein, partial [Patescibacteria group bacterium]